MRRCRAASAAHTSTQSAAAAECTHEVETCKGLNSPRACAGLQAPHTCGQASGRLLLHLPCAVVCGVAARWRHLQGRVSFKCCSCKRSALVGDSAFQVLQLQRSASTQWHLAVLPTKMVIIKMGPRHTDKNRLELCGRQASSAVRRRREPGRTGIEQHRGLDLRRQGEVDKPTARRRPH